MITYNRTYYGPMPPLTITYDQLTIKIHLLLMGRTGGFSFNMITDQLKQLAYANPEEYGYNPSANTIYTGGLDRKDISKVREIIWDLIILRRLTIGNYQSDVWPELSVTAAGEDYFAQVT